MSQVLQDLDFFARCDDFLVGQALSPVTAGVAGVWLRQMLLCGAALQAARRFHRRSRVSTFSIRNVLILKKQRL